MNEPPEKHDRTAHAALALCILPLISVAIGFPLTRAAEVMEAQVLFNWTFGVTGALSLLPMVTAVAALAAGVRDKERTLMALLAILVPIALLLIFFFGCFRLTWFACYPA